MSYTATVILNILITMTAVISMFVLMGLTGIFSMGQASFMCIGAYIAGILATKTDVPFLIALICAILGGMLCAFLVGIPIMKLRGDYVAMVTLAFGEAIVAVLNTFSSVTGGAMGINRIPRKINLISGTIIVLIVIYLVLNFKNSKFGRQCIAVKNDPISAASMGINVTRVKMIAFMFAGALTALSGAMLAFATSYIDPNSFGSAKSIDCGRYQQPVRLCGDGLPLPSADRTAPRHQRAAHLDSVRYHPARYQLCPQRPVRGA